MTCVEREIDQHFEGTISPACEQAMRAHLPGCPSCRARYERWLVLAQIDPSALSAETRIGRGLGLSPRPARIRPVSLAAGATVLALAASVLFWVHSRSDSDSFTARGGAFHSSVSRVFVYDVRPGRPAELATESVARGDELAFAYENGAAKDRLMIFGVDEHRHVYWFYPAWSNPTDNPVAIPIERDERRHELPEAVRQNFDGSQLEIRALFLESATEVTRQGSAAEVTRQGSSAEVTRQGSAAEVTRQGSSAEVTRQGSAAEVTRQGSSITVTQIEAMIRQDPSGPLPIPGAIETTTSFAVTP